MYHNWIPFSLYILRSYSGMYYASDTISGKILYLHCTTGWNATLNAFNQKFNMNKQCINTLTNITKQKHGQWLNDLLHGGLVTMVYAFYEIKAKFNNTCRMTDPTGNSSLMGSLTKA